MASCTQDQQLTHLPEQMFIEILTRLPVKSLLRSKCVCKNWYALIQNPSFAQDHFRLQKLQDKGRIFFQYLKYSYDDGTSKYSYALFPDETLASDACHDLGFLETPRDSPYVYGPVNGLFCVFVKDDRLSFIIWNPAIREFRTLPSVGRPKSPSNLSIVCSNIGFGFDKSNDCYKVVLSRVLFYKVKDMPVVVDVHVHVYAQSTNTWSHLNSLDYLSAECLRRPCGIGAYLDGVYYWWAETRVLAFDMGNEVFRVISVPFVLPSEADKYDLKPYNGDRIALYQFKGFPESGLNKCCDIWVMKEGNWIKRSSVGPIPYSFQQEFWSFWKNGVLLFHRRIPGSYGSYDGCVFQLVLYNPCTRELRYLGPRQESIGYQALVYHESLVSVNGGIHQTVDSSAILLQLEPSIPHFDP